MVEIVLSLLINLPQQDKDRLTTPVFLQEIWSGLISVFLVCFFGGNANADKGSKTRKRVWKQLTRACWIYQHDSWSLLTPISGGIHPNLISVMYRGWKRHAHVENFPRKFPKCSGSFLLEKYLRYRKNTDNIYLLLRNSISFCETKTHPEKYALNKSHNIFSRKSTVFTDKIQKSMRECLEISVKCSAVTPE